MGHACHPRLGVIWASAVIRCAGGRAASAAGGGKGAGGGRRVRDGSSDVFLPLDYSRQSKLDRAERLVREESFDDAVRLLGELISESGRVRIKGASRKIISCALSGGSSLKQEVLSADCGRCRRPGRSRYELHYGAAARKLLEQGLTERDIEPLEEASRRYSHTQAGEIATLLLARHYFDSGWPLAAARIYDRVDRTCRRGEIRTVTERAGGRKLVACRSARGSSARFVAISATEAAGQFVSLANRERPFGAKGKIRLTWLEPRHRDRSRRSPVVPPTSGRCFVATGAECVPRRGASR